MKALRSLFPAAFVIGALFFQASPGQAHEAGFQVDSPGSPGAAINVNGVEGGGEWAGADVFDVDYMNGDPLVAEVKALHKDDGIYLLIVISDNMNNNNDAVDVYFDIDHSGGGAPAAGDWGLRIRRNNVGTWGMADADPGTWGNIPDAEFEATSTGTDWTIEVRLPVGAPSGLSLAAGTVGVYFALYDADLAFGENTAKYTQWPDPPMENDPPPLTPNDWGNYVFDPTTTFPDVAITEIRNTYDGAENYRKISHTADNNFQVRLQNPGGTAIGDATGVRVNLYLAARGIGEPFKRIDAGAVIDGDCAAATWNSLVVAKNQVCTGNSSHPDVSTMNINDVVNNTANYTIKDGMPMNRLGGNPTTVNAGANDWADILLWDTTNPQDGFFTEVMVDGTTYKRQHQCMKAEAIFPNDPNTANNTRQVNMDFVCVPSFQPFRFDFSIGWAGFGEYEPSQGKNMFLQASFDNVDPEANWSFELEGVEQVGEGAFVVPVRGTQSVGVKGSIMAPPGALGSTVKENLIVPPEAGGLRPDAVIPSGEIPVYVQVRPGSTILIAHYSFAENDVQLVDLDGEGFLPANGPNGLTVPHLEKLLDQVEERFRLLLVPDAPLGSLVGSFDNFRTGFLIGDGVQVAVPSDARFLALGINGLVGLYNDNEGTGFRVKITETRPAARAAAGLGLVEPAFAQESRIRTTPIAEVMPTLCLRGYEPIEHRRNLGGSPHELYRYVGEVCWGIINVFPRDRPQEAESADVPKRRCGFLRGRSASVALLATFFGLMIVGRRSRRNDGRLGGE